MHVAYSGLWWKDDAIRGDEALAVPEVQCTQKAEWKADIMSR